MPNIEDLTEEQRRTLKKNFYEKVDQFGVLNPLTNNSKSVFNENSSNFVNTLFDVAKEYYEVDTLIGVEEFVGVVLYASNSDLAPFNLSTSNWLQNLYSGNESSVKVIARIPELHAHLPLPRSNEDWEVLSMYPAFIGNTNEVPPVGTLVRVSFKNIHSLSGPIYLGRKSDTNSIDLQAFNSKTQTFNGRQTLEELKESGRIYDYRGIISRGSPPPHIIENLKKTALMMDAVHLYLVQQGYNITKLKPKYNGGYSPEGHLNSRDTHATGAAIDFNTYYMINGQEQLLEPTIVWASILKLRRSGILPKGGTGMYLEGGQSPSSGRVVFPKWSDTPHMDFRDTPARWVWVNKIPQKGSNRIAWLQSFEPLIQSLPNPDKNIEKVK